jgi:natural product precursor
MKRVKNLIKLTNLNSERLNEKELRHVVGGECHCGCFYAACGGSSKIANDGSNTEHGFVSPLPPFEAQWGIVT